MRDKDLKAIRASLGRTIDNLTGSDPDLLEELQRSYQERRDRLSLPMREFILGEKLRISVGHDSSLYSLLCEHIGVKDLEEITSLLEQHYSSEDISEVFWHTKRVVYVLVSMILDNEFDMQNPEDAEWFLENVQELKEILTGNFDIDS